MAQTGLKNPEDCKADVISQLSSDSRLNDAHIRVDVSDGTVVLSGTVPTYSDRQGAEEDAYAIPGVRSVENRLKVRFPAGVKIPSDQEIARNITNVLKMSPNVDAARIRVSVLDGVVTLTGLVHSSWQKDNAGQLAENVTGVMAVDNRLRVEPATAVQDRLIEKDIRNSLARSVSVNADNVVILVKDGIVTLKGTVDNYHAYRTVRDIANYTSGVVRVNNELVVKG